MVQKLPANAGDIRDAGSIPGSERSPWEGNGNPLQCSCLDNPMDRGAWWATIHGVTVRHNRSDLVHAYIFPGVSGGLSEKLLEFMHILMD